MDLIPKPRQVLRAAGNVAKMVRHGGVADLRPMPSTLLEEGILRRVHHYTPTEGTPPKGDPVLLVTPLAAPALCYDLRRDCSMVEHLVGTGRPTYLVDYGHVSFRDRALGMEHWIDDVLPVAVREVSRHAGGRPVHVVGWSLGGIFALLTTAEHTDLPIASLTGMGTPFDVRKVPLVAPVRPLLNVPPVSAPVEAIYQTFGGTPTTLVKWAYTLTGGTGMITRPITKMMNLDDTDRLAQYEAVGRFMDSMTAYPGRTFGQLYHRFIRANGLRRGTFELTNRTIRLADIEVPVMLVAGRDDTIAPLGSVFPGKALLTGAPRVRFETVPGGHLGLVTGRKARDTTWPLLDEWFARYDEPAQV